MSCPFSLTTRPLFGRISWTCAGGARSMPQSQRTDVTELLQTYPGRSGWSECCRTALGVEEVAQWCVARKHRRQAVPRRESIAKTTTGGECVASSSKGRGIRASAAHSRVGRHWPLPNERHSSNTGMPVTSASASTQAQFLLPQSSLARNCHGLPLPTRTGAGSAAAQRPQPRRIRCVHPAPCSSTVALAVCMSGDGGDSGGSSRESGEESPQQAERASKRARTEGSAGDTGPSSRWLDDEPSSAGPSGAHHYKAT